MILSPRSFLPVVIAFIAGTGCSTASSIVKKPEIHQVKKIAIVSITAPQRVPHRGGKGQVAGWGDENRRAIADQTLAVYAAEFKKLGWDVIAASQVSALPIYQEDFAPKFSKNNTGIAKTLNSLSASDSQNTYFSPTGLYPVAWEDDSRQSAQSGTMRLDLGSMSLEKNKSLKTKMQEVAAQAGADAAILVQADYCYDNGAIWVGHVGSGTGSAVITGASAIYAVTPKGVEVIKMKRIQSCGGEHRVASDSSTPMVSGNLLYSSDQIQKMFLEVARKNAADNVSQIQTAMKD